MLKALSKDGTSIAYEVSGKGPAIVLVDGALCYHDSGPGRKIARLLSKNFTVYLYDRRGRGESGDTQPYNREREIEDLEAIIQVAGGSAGVFAQSSGAILSLEAAQRLGPKMITRLAVYEAPLISNNDRFSLGEDTLRHMKALIAVNKRSAAIKFFFKSIELPGVFSVLLPLTPLWPKMKSIAHTLPYDFAITTPYQTGKPLPKTLWQQVVAPTWVGAGSKSPDWMQYSERMLADLLPSARYHVLPAQTHNLNPKKIAPELCDFFKY
jgi:pimeloyl-ACP methyl ester carboxylesterase